MNTIDNSLQISSSTIDKLRIFFFEPVSKPTIVERILTRAIQDITTVFGFREVNDIVHCCVQLGDSFYEVSLHKTTKLDITLAEIIKLGNLVAVYEIDILTLADERKLAAKFMLENDVLSQRKINIQACLNYCLSFLRFRSKEMALDEQIIDYAQREGYLTKFTLRMGLSMGMRVCLFNLPFTCATQVSNVMVKLFNIEPVYDAFLPASLFTTVSVLAELNYGELKEPDEL